MEESLKLINTAIKVSKSSWLCRNQCQLLKYALEQVRRQHLSGKQSCRALMIAIELVESCRKGDFAIRTLVRGDSSEEFKQLLILLDNILSSFRFSVSDFIGPLTEAAKKDKQELLRVLHSRFASRNSISRQVLKSGRVVHIDRNRFKLQTYIGAGNYGVVYEASWLGHPFAVKYLRDRDISQNASSKLASMEALRHPNIVSIIAYSFEKEREQHVVVMEKMDMNLNEFIQTQQVTQGRSNGSSFSLEDAIALIFWIACGLKFLQSKNIMHTHLETRHILVNKGEVLLQVKLSSAWINYLAKAEASGLRRSVLSFFKVCYIILTGKESSMEYELPPDCPAEIRDLLVIGTRENVEHDLDFVTICDRLASTMKSGSLTRKNYKLTGAFTKSQIIEMTENFAETHLIRLGGYENTYKGRLGDGTIVAIKRIQKNGNTRGMEMTRNEVDILAKVKHENIVQLLGYVEDNEDCIVVYEFVSNGTLEQHLDGLHGGLEFSERLNIAVDVANALLYLHLHKDGPIVHSNVNSSNILLTEGLKAKLIGFELATEVGGEETTEVRDTISYLGPTFIQTKQLKSQSDIYYFGVLLIEIFSSVRARIKARLDISLIDWARSCHEDGTIERVFSGIPTGISTLISELAFQCTSPIIDDRPAMKQIVDSLLYIFIVDTEHIWRNQLKRETRFDKTKWAAFHPS